MKINDKTLAKYASSGAPPDKEGFLKKRGDLNRGYQKRWFILKGNLLFYYEKRMDKDPIGMIVLEGCRVELSDSEDGFTFMLQFPGPHSRTYVISADTQEDMEAWMKALSSASYDYIRICVNELKATLREADTVSNKKLLQGAIDDRNNFVQSGHIRHSQEGPSNNVSSYISGPIKRHNPFDDGSFDHESISERDSVTSRSFTEMHEEFRAEIKEITSVWVKNHPNSNFSVEYCKKYGS
ncbi:hypothetical protein ACF0H5_017494 [Mactra antiquata]